MAMTKIGFPLTIWGLVTRHLIIWKNVKNNSRLLRNNILAEHEMAMQEIRIKSRKI